MMTSTETAEIIQILKRLPPDKIVEVRDFIHFLQSQYLRSTRIDESDEWSDEDLADFTASSDFAKISG